MSLRIVETDAASTRALRRSVLRPSWPPDAAMHGDDNLDAVHLGAFAAGELVAACLILPLPYPRRPDVENAWQLRGMAAEPFHRNRGVGARLLAATVGTARGRGGRLMWCEARTSALRFYAQHGFAVDGPEYLHSESGIPHHLMFRTIDPGDPVVEPDQVRDTSG
jgi:GNAT superfamily N-acetyltransferase